MHRVVRRIAVTVAVVVAPFASGCRGERPTDATQRSAGAAITWREVGSWSGRLGQQSESFEVSTTPMRLRWQTTRETSPGAGRLTVTLHSQASGRQLQTIMDAHGVSSGTASVAEEPRWAYFVIDAANVEWQMTLEEQVYATAPQ